MREQIKKIIPNILLQRYHNFRRYRKNRIIIGNNVECSICKSQFNFFQSYGQPQRKNAKCHNCGSLERHRLLWKYFNEELDFFNENTKGSVLHFAPEKFFYDFIDSFGNVEYIPCDLFPEQYQFEGNSETKKVDIINIPFENNYFDFIICNHVLEHIPDDTLAMSELYRVMKKGGCGVFQVPINYNRKSTYEDFSISTPKGREKAFGQADHVRWYGLDYKERLEKVGFKVEVDNYVKRFSKKELKRYGFISSELIYKVSK